MFWEVETFGLGDLRRLWFNLGIKWASVATGRLNLGNRARGSLRTKRTAVVLFPYTVL
jgi:hypothetical protein